MDQDKRLKKRYLSGAGVLAYILVSKRGQQQLENIISDSLVRPFKEFEYQSGVTALSAWHWPVILCSFYLISVYLLRNYMKDKQVFDLYWLRVVHNAFLSFASFVMVCGVLKEIAYVAQNYGVEALLCDENARQSEGNLFFWYYVFFLSKFYEFIDTYILCLRKKPITFLHCFHHFITAFLCWVGLYSKMAPQWIVISLNGTIHVFMYYYYLAQTLGFDVWWKKYLTTGQIIQFCLDLIGIGTWWYYFLVEERNCSGNIPSLFFANFVLGSFLLLFLNFYRKTYNRKDTKGDNRKTAKAE